MLGSSPYPARAGLVLAYRLSAESSSFPTPTGSVLHDSVVLAVVALLQPSTDFQVQLISAVIDLGTLHDCQQAGLTQEHFSQWPDVWKFVETHQRQHGRTPTRQTLENRFPRMSFPRGQQGDLNFLINEVRGQWLYDKLSGMLEQTVRLMTSPDHQVEDALRHIQSQAHQLGLSHGSQERDTNLLQEGQSHILDQAVRRIKAHLDPSLAGIRTGFSEFDQTTGGLDDTEFVVLLARVTQGKSWGLLYMAVNALLQGKNVLFFPLEMSKTQVAFRLHVILQAFFLERHPQEMAGLQPFLNKSLTQGTGYDLPSYKKFLELLGNNLKGSFVVSECPGKLTPSIVFNKIQQHKPDCVYIDYLTLMTSDGNQRNDAADWQAIKSMTNDLKSIANGQHVPIVTAAQATRGAVHRKGPPELEEIAFGDAIGQDADRVLSLKQLSRRISTYLTIKNRHADSRAKGYLEHHWNQGKIREVSETRAMDILQEDADRGDLISERGLK